jgi:predicted small lipoprotein YifL
MRKLFLIFGMALALTACGVKNDLLTPAGKSTPKSDTDPSKPPQPIGR